MADTPEPVPAVEPNPVAAALGAILKPPAPVIEQRFMRRSPSIANLVQALAAAQGEMEPAVRDSVNPFYSTESKQSTYPSLGSIIKACGKPLSKQGIARFQAVRAGQRSVEVETMLALGDEFVAETIRLPAVAVDRYGNEKFDSQTIKAASTYGRRIGLESLAGVPVEGGDDDAETIGEGAARPGETYATDADNQKANAHIPPTPSVPGMSKDDEARLKEWAASLEKDITKLEEMNAIAVKQFREIPKSPPAYRAAAWKALQDFGKQQGWKWSFDDRTKDGLFIQATTKRQPADVDDTF